MNFENLKKFNFSFPILVGENFLEKDFYQTLKNNFPDFNNNDLSIRKTQEYRENITISKTSDDNYQCLNSHFKTLFNLLNEKKFLNQLWKHFDDKLLKKNEFIGNKKDLEIYFQLGESIDGYETPWHVDTRNRCIVMMFFFGNDEIIEGGEFGIAKVKSRDKLTDYKRFAYTKDILEQKLFKPQDNKCIIFLSTCNSYHKAFKTIGRRRFVYLTFRTKKKCWKTPEIWENDKEMSKAWIKGIDLSK
jgi:hypothetical protein